MRVMLCDDGALFRNGLAMLLTDTGVEVAGQARDVAELRTLLTARVPDAVILDIRMPPTFTDEGLAAAAELTKTHPGMAILVLSTYDDTAYARRLLDISQRGVGYLLKDRVDDPAQVREALDRVTRGELVIDPEIVAKLVARQQVRSWLDELTQRQKEVLGLMAEGRSNTAIARLLHVEAKTVEGHIATILDRLSLEPGPDDNRRVLAVLAWLQATH